MAFFTFQHFHHFVTHLSNLLDGSDIFYILSVLLSVNFPPPIPVNFCRQLLPTNETTRAMNQVKLANVVIKTGHPSEYIVGLPAPQRT